MPSLLQVTAPGYQEFLEGLKARIRTAQVRASLSVNRELVLLYWEIGREIAHRQAQSGWGAKVIDRLAADLRSIFPEMKGFSLRNLKYMRAFALAWPDAEFVQQAAAQIPWFHNCVILDKIRTPEERSFYVAQTLEHGWSRNVLVAQIESGLHARQGQAITNFERTLPPPDSDLAHQALKDPYVFDFLELASDVRERELERSLVEHVRAFLLELGVGFAFVGHQVHLEVGGQDFYLDMLFYHLRLRCYIVVELKTGEFQPEHAGKMNFYLSAVDDRLRHPDDGPSIGLLLCKSKYRRQRRSARRGRRGEGAGVLRHRLGEGSDRRGAEAELYAVAGAGRPGAGADGGRLSLPCRTCPSLLGFIRRPP